MKINMKFTAKSEAQSRYYLELIYEGKEYFIEDFAENFKESNLEELLKRCEIKYKGKTYSYEQLGKEQFEFAESLEIPSWYISDLIKIEHLIFINNQNYFAALKQIEKVESLINKARFALVLCTEKIVPDIQMRWQYSYGPQFLCRSIYLQNAILWYNACEDYLLQALWVCFEFYRKSKYFKEGMSPRQILKLYSYKALMDIFTEYESSPNIKALSKIIQTNRRLLKELRGWANTIKHSGDLDIEGIYIEPVYEVKSTDPGSGVSVSTNDFQPTLVDLDRTIENLKRVHHNCINYCQQIIDFIDFFSALPGSHENGGLIRTNKTQYRKINL